MFNSTPLTPIYSTRRAPKSSALTVHTTLPVGRAVGRPRSPAVAPSEIALEKAEIRGALALSPIQNGRDPIANIPQLPHVGR